MAGTIGFDAITVALLGRATPLGTVLAGLLFGALSVGGVAMQAAPPAPPGADPGAPGADRAVRRRAGAGQGILRIKDPEAARPSWRRDGDHERRHRGVDQPRAAGRDADVRDRADVRRQVQAGRGLRAGRWSRCSGSCSSIDSPDGRYTLGRADHPGRPRPRPRRSARWSRAASWCRWRPSSLAALNRVPRGWLGRWCSSLVGRRLLHRLPDLGVRRPDRSRCRSRSPTRCPGTISSPRRSSSARSPACLCERAGVINIAIEGQFLIGAFFASVFSSCSTAPRWASSAASSPVSRSRRCWRSSRCATRSTRWSSASCWSRSPPA